MSGVVTVPELLNSHTVLDVECLDRICLNGYVPMLQVGGQVVTFSRGHPRMPIASPAVIKPLARRARAPGRRLDPAQRDHLAQAQRYARVGYDPAGQTVHAAIVPTRADIGKWLVSEGRVASHVHADDHWSADPRAAVTRRADR